jgi:hypothetical protein
VVIPFGTHAQAAKRRTVPTQRKIRRAGIVTKDETLLQWAAKFGRLRVEHPEAARLIEQLIDDSLYGD